MITINKKNIVTLMLACLLVVSMIGLFKAGVEGENIGTYPSNSYIKLPQSCSSCTYSNISSIILPNQTIYVGDFSMVKNGTSFYYEFYTEEFGTYKVNGHFDVDGIDKAFNYIFEVTPSGKVLSTPQSISYLGFIIFLLLILASIPFIANKLPSINSRDEQGRILQISYLKYLRSALWFAEYMVFTAMIFVASNLSFYYLGDELLHKFFFTFFQILMGLALPVIIVWFIWIFARAMEDKQIKQLLSRGIFPGEQI